MNSNNWQGIANLKGLGLEKRCQKCKKKSCFLSGRVCIKHVGQNIQRIVPLFGSGCMAATECLIGKLTKQLYHSNILPVNITLRCCCYNKMVEGQWHLDNAVSEVWKKKDGKRSRFKFTFVLEVVGRNNNLYKYR